MKLAALAVLGAGVALVFATLEACNEGTADCPAKETIQPGGACSDDTLQCAYDLPSPSPACDGTTTVLATSCTCTKGTWSCPDPASCPSGDDDAAGDDDANGDDAAGDDGSASDAPDAG